MYFIICTKRLDKYRGVLHFDYISNKYYLSMDASPQTLIYFDYFLNLKNVNSKFLTQAS